MNISPKSLASLARWLSLLILLAGMLNGAVFWLKRVGWLDGHLHQTYYSRFHHGPEYEVSPEESEGMRLFTAELYRPRGWQSVLKLAKDAVGMLFLACTWHRPW